MLLDIDWKGMWEETKEWAVSTWADVSEFASEYRILLIGLAILIVAAIVVIILLKKMPKKHLSITEAYDANGRKIDE